MNGCAHSENALMHRLNSRFLAPMVFIVVLFIGLISYQSIFGIQPPPAQFEQTDGTAVTDDNQTLIRFTRKVHVTTHIRIMMNRSIECGKLTMTYDFPTAYREMDAGDYVFDRRLMVPFKIDPGTSCTIYTLIQYQPTFSIRTHSYYAPEVHTVVAAK